MAKFREYPNGFRIRVNPVTRGYVGEPAWLRIGGFGYSWDFRDSATEWAVAT